MNFIDVEYNAIILSDNVIKGNFQFFSYQLYRLILFRYTLSTENAVQDHRLKTTGTQLFTSINVE